MDFKKAYEDALERAKGIYNENPSSSTAKFVCGQIFPELKESEDERIRKWISDRLLANYSKEDDMVKEALVWLEKQKEQEPSHTAKDMWKEMRLEVYAQASGNRHEPNYSDDSTKLFSLCDIDEIFEKIGNSTVESQPAERSDVERKQLYSDGFDTARKALAGAFMQYIDEHRPEGKMCLSNGECAQLDNAFKVGDVETIVRYINKYQQPAKSPLAEGVYYIKDGQPVAEYKDGVETDRLLVVGKYCRFYLSMADLGKANYEDAQNKAASLGEGWRCPDSFEGRTIGKMSDEISNKAAKIGAEHFENKGWFWTNEVFDRWNACRVYFYDGSVSYSDMRNAVNVLALSAFQN